jgi:type VI secretion system protein VasJ
VRVATWYVWARLHRDGEAGLADGLLLLAALVNRFGNALLPARRNSRKMALEWLAGDRVLDSLALHPEMNRPDFERIVAALALLEKGLAQWQEEERPALRLLYSSLEVRLAQSGGMDAMVPQNSRCATEHAAGGATAAGAASVTAAVQSGRELLEQARVLSRYLHEQPQGWLSGHHLMKSVRWDTVHQLPPLDASGRTRLAAPRGESRAQLKRLYLQQNWRELLEQAGSMFGEGVNHFWLDLQWYLHQALGRSGPPFDGWADIISQDLYLLLQRMPGLETLVYNDGSAFADEVTQNWITAQVKQSLNEWDRDATTIKVSEAENAVLQLEPEALAQADSEGVEAALSWLQSRPGISSARNRWLLRLVMARVAEQYGKNEMAMHLLNELLEQSKEITLSRWEPELIFEAKARTLKLLRMKAQRSETDKTLLGAKMDALLSGLIAIDPARAAVLCG